MAKNKTRTATQSVRIKNLLSPGSGATILDTIEMPYWLFITVRIIRSLWKHRIFTFSMLIIIGFSVTSYFDLSYAISRMIIFLLIYATVMFTYMLTRFDHGADFVNILVAFKRRYSLKSRLPNFYAAADIKQGFPRVRKLKFNPAGYRFTLKLDTTGKTSYEVASCAPEIASALDAYEVKIDSPRPAIAEVYVSMGDPTQKIIRPGDIPKLIKENTIPFAVDIHNKTPVGLLLFLSLLIVGRSHSGKSNNVWEILNQLNKYQIPYRLRVIDPKGGVELNDLKHGKYTVEYIDNAKDANALISRADEDMNERLAIMNQRGMRKIPYPTEEFPLDILIVDELLNLPDTTVDSKYGRRLTQGRAALHVTYALSQLSQVDALGRTRDLYPQRICMGVDSPDVTNAALGEKAEGRGAKASEIPATTPGIGYMFRDGRKGFTKLQAALIEDDETRLIAQGEYVETQSEKRWTIPSISSLAGRLQTFWQRETATYKLYNSYTRHIYTGIAFDPVERIETHIREQEWGHEIDKQHTEVTWYPTRREAKRAETESIVKDRPLYNKQENPDYRRKLNGVR